MNSKRNLLVLAVLAVSLVGSSALAQEGQPDPQMMQAWMKNISPGEHHAHMKELVGKWKAELISYEGGEQPPIDGTSTYELVLGDRYLKQTMETQMMGMPFTGWGLSGYDNVAKKHTIMWIDTMGTWMTYGEGDCSDEHKVETIWANVRNPLGGPDMKAKMVTTVQSPDKHVFEYFVVGPDGEETKALQINYTRM